MPLSRAERKDRLPHGAQGRIAKGLGMWPSQVSEAIDEQAFPKTKRTKARLRRLQVLVAEELGVPLEDAWSPDQLALSAPGAMARAS